MAKPRNRRYEYILEHLLKLGVKSGSIIIDCACGDGYGSNTLNLADMNVIGYDISEKLVDTSINRGVVAEVSSICSLPCIDSISDVFVCSETLEHLTQQELNDAVGEIKRVTKDNGIICITVPSDSKICLQNKNHKQYLSGTDLEKLFDNCSVLFKGKFCKKPGKCNTVLFFRK